MTKVIIMVPVFNDWKSLIKLISEINEIIRNLNFEFKFLIINDSSSSKAPQLIVPTHMKSIKILNMKKNRGHARCNAFGIRYVLEEEKFDYLILMDGDGEDRPIEIKSLIETISKDPKFSVVAKRVKRAEGMIFQFLYQAHKLITLVFTGHKINFGNYSCLTYEDVKILSTKASLWSSYSGTVKKNLKNFNEVNSIRGIRYFGPSQMSLFKLLVHSLSIIAVFRSQVLMRSLIILIILGALVSLIGKTAYFLQIILVLFNFTILLVSKRENKTDLINSHSNLENVKVLNNDKL